ncbi:hypothetical protein KIN20_017110 [Parelaphostrongylus tenuis]|uniref:Uncharacterized protein n=1 Tax=Parelaphostrongylus tenuis TaxID=148309 RepID=A0AAD5QNF6_PARTN|nr:hypothetical protein KIN20_017110 [Parelaphostrongylus tenuis]
MEEMIFKRSLRDDYNFYSALVYSSYRVGKGKFEICTSKLCFDSRVTLFLLIFLNVLIRLRPNFGTARGGGIPKPIFAHVNMSPTDIKRWLETDEGQGV